jgi:hypothetical protein
MTEHQRGAVLPGGELLASQGAKVNSAYLDVGWIARRRGTRYDDRIAPGHRTKGPRKMPRPGGLTCRVGNLVPARQRQTMESLRQGQGSDRSERPSWHSFRDDPILNAGGDDREPLQGPQSFLARRKAPEQPPRPQKATRIDARSSGGLAVAACGHNTTVSASPPLRPTA